MVFQFQHFGKTVNVFGNVAEIICKASRGEIGGVAGSLFFNGLGIYDGVTRGWNHHFGAEPETVLSDLSPNGEESDPSHYDFDNTFHPDVDAFEGASIADENQSEEWSPQRGFNPMLAFQTGWRWWTIYNSWNNFVFDKDFQVRDGNFHFNGQNWDALWNGFSHFDKYWSAFQKANVTATHILDGTILYKQYDIKDSLSNWFPSKDFPWDADAVEEYENSAEDLDILQGLAGTVEGGADNDWMDHDFDMEGMDAEAHLY